MTKKDEFQQDLNKHTVEFVKHKLEEVKRLRFWMDGFRAAGGKVPACEQSFSALTNIQILLEDYAQLITKYGKEES